MRNEIEEIKTEEEKSKKEYPSMRKTQMNLGSKGHDREEDLKGLNFSRRRRNVPDANKLGRDNRPITHHDNVINLEFLRFDTSKTFSNEGQRRFNQRQTFECQDQYQDFAINKNNNDNLFTIHQEREKSLLSKSENFSDHGFEEN